MASHIVGIMGMKRSGKDTFASRLVSDWGFTRLAFADALKDVALEVDPIVEATSYSAMRLSELVDVIGWERAKDEYREVRRILQHLGVAFRNRVNSRSWVDVVMREADWIPGPVCVTDVRFHNEVAVIQRHRGTIVRVIREGQVNTDAHVSETALNDVPAQLTVRAATGQLDVIHQEADFLAASLGVSPKRKPAHT